MKQKFLKLGIKARNGLHAAKPYMLSLAMMGIMILGNVAFAGNEGKTLFTNIVKLIGAAALAGGAIAGVMGVVAYGEAKSEGEGPAMAKAKNQITGAIILVVIGVCLEGFAGTLSSLIKDNLF